MFKIGKVYERINKDSSCNVDREVSIHYLEKILILEKIEKIEKIDNERIWKFLFDGKIYTNELVFSYWREVEQC